MQNLKEWLNTKTFEYKQAACMFGHSEWLEIPKGADFYVKSKIIEDNYFFCMDNSGVIETYDTMLKNLWHREILTTKDLSKNYEILWQRPTQPEALPFIDDNPQSLSEQYAEIEKVRQHNHYFKDVSNLNEIDVYMVLKLFNVTDPCLQHIAKKALCAGQRGHKDFKKDLQDILDTAKRAVEINNE